MSLDLLKIYDYQGVELIKLDSKKCISDGFINFNEFNKGVYYLEYNISENQQFLKIIK